MQGAGEKWQIWVVGLSGSGWGTGISARAQESRSGTGNRLVWKLRE